MGRLSFTFLLIAVFSIEIFCAQDCNDQLKYCQKFKENGYCSPSSIFYSSVIENCPMSCGTCLACKDDSKHCEVWKNAGYCDPSSKYFSYVSKKCLKSCAICKEKEKYPNCKDVGGYCSAYQPYCNDPDYKDYLIRECKRTCNFCHITTPAPTTTPYISTQPYTGAGGKNLQPGCGKKGQSHARIVGGTNANPGDWPWNVNIDSIWNSGNPGHLCGGTLITNEWVLSAAHCFYDHQNKDDYWLKLGEHDIKTKNKWEQRYTIKELKLHPKYQHNGYDYDLALLRINGTATFNDRVRPACLPGEKETFDVGTTCHITGWGRLKEFGDGPAILQQAKVPLIDHNKCQQAYKRYQYKVTPRMLCAGFSNGTIDSCDGDSGGPLVCKKSYSKTGEEEWYLWGSVSWGIGCARKGLYGVYANLKLMRPWIDTVVFKENN